MIAAARIQGLRCVLRVTAACSRKHSPSPSMWRTHPHVSRAPIHTRHRNFPGRHISPNGANPPAPSQHQSMVFLWAIQKATSAVRRSSVMTPPRSVNSTGLQYPRSSVRRILAPIRLGLLPNLPTSRQLGRRISRSAPGLSSRPSEAVPIFRHTTGLRPQYDFAKRSQSRAEKKYGDIWATKENPRLMALLGVFLRFFSSKRWQTKK